MMSCNPYGTRFYKGKISRTAKRSSVSFFNSSTTKVNDSLKSKVNLMQVIASVAAHFQTLTKIPFWRNLYRQGKRG